MIHKISLLPLQFSLEQKSAIIISLLALAKVEGFIPAHHFRYLERLLALLNIGENCNQFEGMFDAGTEASLVVLRDLWDNQKEWYVMMVYGLEQIDKTTGKKEVLKICDKINITHRQYHYIVRKIG